MWTSRNRARYDRSKLRYPSDVTDEEWELMVPLIPPGKSGGGKRTVIMREVVNGLMYVLSTGCQWRAIPKDLPPKSTVYDYFDLWTYDGTLQRIHYALYDQCREQAQREASPSAAIIDSQSVKSAEKGGACIDAPGYDAGKKIKGKKRHVLVDTLGLLLHAVAILPTSKIEMEPFSSWRPCSGCFPFFKSCSLTVAIRGRNSAPR